MDQESSNSQYVSFKSSQLSKQLLDADSELVSLGHNHTLKSEKSQSCIN